MTLWLILKIFIAAAISFVSVIKDYKESKKLSITTIIIVSLIVVYAITDIIDNKISHKGQEKDKVEVMDAINKTHDLIGVKEFPGFTITALLKIQELKEERRKYIFDIGIDPRRNRISLYLDFDNNLVYSIIDNAGVPHTIKIPQKIHTFEFNTLYFIHCEFGDAKEFNYMRLSINNQHFDPLKFKNKLNIPDNLQQKPGTLFTDIEKKEFSSMTISQYSVMRGTMTDEKMNGFMDIINKYMNSIKTNK